MDPAIVTQLERPALVKPAPPVLKMNPQKPLSLPELLAELPLERDLEDPVRFHECNRSGHGTLLNTGRSSGLDG